MTRVLARFVEVVQEDAGTALTVDVDVDDTVLLVTDTVDFEVTGVVQLGPALNLKPYLEVTDTTITLAEPLTEAYPESTSVAPIGAQNRTKASYYVKALVDDDERPVRAAIPRQQVPFLQALPADTLLELELVRRRWRLVTVPGLQPLFDGIGQFASESLDSGTRVTLTIAENPFGLDQDWALLEFWADDPTLAAGKIWARYNDVDGYASLTIASPALKGEEADAAQLILSKNADGSQLATLIAEQIDLAAQTFSLGSLDASSIDLRLVGSSLIQFFSDMFAPTGYLNFNLADAGRTTIGAWDNPDGEGDPVLKALRLKAAEIEFDSADLAAPVTVAGLVARIEALESP